MSTTRAEAAAGEKIRYMRALRSDAKDIVSALGIVRGLEVFNTLISGSFVLDVGDACNNDCPYCSSRSADRPPTFVHLDVLAAKVDEAGAAGFRSVLLTGGEPTLYPHLLPLLKRINLHGGVLLQSNGVALADKNVCRRLHDAGLRMLFLSFDDVRPEVARRLAGGREGRPEAVEAALRNMADFPDVHVMLYVCVTALNVDGLSALVAKADEFRRWIGRDVSVCMTTVRLQGKAFLRRDEVGLSSRDAAAYIRVALDEANRRGVPAGYRNLPPCQLSGYRSQNIDLMRWVTTVDLDLDPQRFIPEYQDAAPLRDEGCEDCPDAEGCPGLFPFENRVSVRASGNPALHPLAESLDALTQSLGELRKRQIRFNGLLLHGFRVDRTGVVCRFGTDEGQKVTLKLLRPDDGQPAFRRGTQVQGVVALADGERISPTVRTGLGRFMDFIEAVMTRRRSAP